MTEVRRIRRLRKPTKWETLVWRWQTWLEDMLARAVCCGVEPTPSPDNLRSTLGLRKESSFFSIGSMAPYGSSDNEQDSHAENGWWSDTDSESDVDLHSIDMNARMSSVEDSDEEGTTSVLCASVCSERVPFDDEIQSESERYACMTGQEGCDEPALTTVHDYTAAAMEEALYHHALFNCVLVELLSNCHPAATWTR